jgi:hypothetical protein
MILGNLDACEDACLKKDQSADIDEALRLADQLLGKPLSWTEPLAPERSDCPVFRFVIFRGFIRAVSQYNPHFHFLSALVVW